MEYETVQGTAVPKIGLGTWQTDGQETYGAVRTALAAGYRHIDTAQAYDNERYVGNAIHDADVDREDVFLTTKVRPDRFRPGRLKRSVANSIRRLDTSYVDLLLLHWPNPLADLRETMEAMADLVERGDVRHVGVSNFSKKRLMKAQRVSPEPIFTNQVKLHPFKPQRDLLRYCQDSNVLLTAYSPLGTGGVLDDDLLRSIGTRYDKTPAQVALRWATQHRNVVAIPKSTSEDHIEQNIDIFDFKLDRDELDRIARPDPVRNGLAFAKGSIGI
ncbi:aldo/keto reductase [Haloarchaeobius iranensis]|uniref:Aldo/keto reductase n=1 Tax=Haloarchaeobius iranensis TaxID=996166 RepID=A0A1G9TUG9_9EURY|nr:aldo/keto reductase [Haloarchaeobius iranensis]SDM51356.1 Aldo/keto reductase [Haloarchaeobius iranensis]